jgi:hypothetical protein
MTNQVKLYRLKSPRSHDEDKCIKFKLNTVFYEAVATVGCPAYRTAQSEACSCSKDLKLNAVSLNGKD